MSCEYVEAPNFEAGLEQDMYTNRQVYYDVDQEFNHSLLQKLPKLFDQSVTGKHSPEHNGARRNVPQVSIPTFNQPSPLQSPGHAVPGNAADVRAKHKPMTGKGMLCQAMLLV